MANLIKKPDNNKAEFLIFEDGTIVNLAHVSAIEPVQYDRIEGGQRSRLYFNLLVSGKRLSYTRTYGKILATSTLQQEKELFEAERKGIVQNWISLFLPKGVEMERETLKLH